MEDVNGFRAQLMEYFDMCWECYDNMSKRNANGQESSESLHRRM